MATYTNRPISKACQLAELKNRGLVVGDDNQAIEYLGSINYFRFACYLLPFEIDPATHQYAVGTSFDQIIELYQFDKELRSLIFTAIQDVEIALRSRIIHHFSMSHGTFWFLNRNMFKDKSIFNTTLQKEWNEVNRSKEDFIQDFFDRYDNTHFTASMENAGGCVFRSIVEDIRELCRGQREEVRGKGFWPATIHVS